MTELVKTRDRQQVSTAAAVLLNLTSAMWAGLIVGVSFLATLVKFRAPSLTMPVALDVGVHTFTALVRVEWVFVAVTVVLWWLARPVWLHFVGHLLQLTFFLIEALWLLPLLEVRALIVIAGGTNAPSHAHFVFVALEAIRVILLLVLGGLAIRRQGEKNSPHRCHSPVP